ncbi:organic cation/carnitine transporter 7 isoform X2 [Cryptomeria japonica]|nr:organic cation/carnitine transporter 7 isoform X2 [Cryptomeria japonica]XP_057813178.1 organic cation/carnitine transporter 7 isoform X2 [Cryptomeria japonica]XP_057813179.1 organic cation/carnitine transporter 7 isoform X2 [Cryptomeria japonica]XP_057813180.1 organic cation/carnitine transporter 7 isoform X2 [Cryptomeria japonica]
MEVDSPVFTVDDALQIVGFGKYQVLLLAYAGMGWVAEAMEMMLLSFIGPAVSSEWELSPRQESLITSTVFLGMMVGAYLWGVLSDTKGRRYGFFATAVVTFGAGFFGTFSPNYLVLVASRCLVGLGIGGGPVLSSWFLEFIPMANRGFWMVIFSAFWTFGTILEALIAWIVMPTLGWRWLVGLSSTPLLILLVFYSVVPESPRYLIMKGRTIDALQILNKIAQVNRKHLPPGRYVACVTAKTKEVDGVDKLEEAHLLDVKGQSSETSSKIRNQMRLFSSLCTLLSPSLITSTLLLWSVFFSNAFCYYGLVLLTSQFGGRNQNCASNTMTSAATNNSSLYRDILMASCGEIPGLLLAAIIVDFFGRKSSMAIMFFSCCMFFLPLMFPQHETMTTILLFGARLCITGTNTIAYIYAPEVYPTSIRSTGLGTASSFARIGGVLSPLIAIWLVKVCQQKLAILLFEFVLLLGAISALFLPKETKGQTLTDFV